VDIDIIVGELNAENKVYHSEARSVNRGGAWGVSPPPCFRKFIGKKGFTPPLLLKISFFLLMKIEK
jgi:hypothetical protein